jgi:hypothetical protein
VVKLVAPVDADLLPPTIAISPTGSVAIGYGVTSENAPQDASAELIAGTVRQRGALGARLGKPEQVPSAQRVLAVGTLGGQLELLTGDGDGGSLTGDPAATGVQCCTEMDAQGRIAGGLYTAGQALVSGLDGGGSATLVPEPSGALAILASGNGIWTAYGSNHKASFGATSQLAAFSGQPPAVAAGTLAGGRALIVWTEPRTALNVATKRQSVYYAVAPAGGAPGSRRLAFTVPAGYSVSQVAAARQGGVASIAWVESWFDITGRYHSQVYAADLHGRRAVATHAISPVGEIATQLSFAGGTSGPELLTWQACTPRATTCTAQAALRPRGAAWRRAVRLGAIGPSDAPVAAMTSRGTALVGWVDAGGVKLASAPAGTTRFSARRLDRSTTAAHLTLATGPRGDAAAVWTDGLARQSLRAAFYRPGAGPARRKARRFS